MALQRIKRGGTGIDTGAPVAPQVAAQAWGSLADRLNQFRLRKEAEADQQAQIEGKRAGVLKGIRGEVPNPDLETIRGRAEAQGVQTGYMLAHEAESRTRLAELAVQYQSDPQGFMKVADAYAKGKLSTISDPVLREQVSLDYQTRIQAKSIDLMQDQVTLQRETGKADALAGLRAIETDVLDSARAGRVDLALADQQRHMRYLEQQVAARHLTPVEAEKQRVDLENKVQAAQVLGAFHGELRRGTGWEFIQNFSQAGDLGMSEEGRTLAIDNMQDMLRDWQTEQTRRERATDKAMKDRQEMVEAQNVEALYAGDLTAETLRQQRDSRQISPGGYERQRKALALAQEPQDDIALVAGIYDDMYGGGDVGVLHQRIIEGVAAGSIEQETFRNMLNTLRGGQLRDITRQPEWGEAVDSINRQLQSTGPMQAFDLDEQRRISAAKRELYERTAAGENPLDIVDGIIDRAQPAGRRDLAPALRPRYFEAGMGGQIDVPASRQRARAAYNAGQIDLQELDKQYRAIDAWEQSALREQERRASQDRAAKEREARLR